MITHHTSKGLIWLDVSNPDTEEIAGLIKRYDLHPLVGEELKSSSSLAKIDFYKDYILVVLTLPVRIRNKKNDAYEIVDREVDFVIGKNFLITSRFDTIEQLEYFGKIFETNSIINKEEKIDHAGHLFYYMVKRIYAGMCEDLENIKDSLINAETRIFGGDERKMVEALSGLSRELIDFKQTARVHEEIWQEMVAYDETSLFGKEFTVYMRDIRDEFNRIRELISNSRELLADLRETNDSLLNTRQNEIIKRLTLVAFIFQPATFIAALFTIPALNVPLIEHGIGWYAIFLFMIVISASIWWLFRKKRWL
ncbi:MAG: CorA family divalent cation transporter [Patescibacteria group bacterium]